MNTPVLTTFGAAHPRTHLAAACPATSHRNLNPDARHVA